MYYDKNIELKHKFNCIQRKKEIHVLFKKK